MSGMAVTLLCIDRSAGWLLVHISAAATERRLWQQPATLLSHGEAPPPHTLKRTDSVTLLLC